MLFLNQAEMESVKSAIEYSDQGVLKTAYDKIDGLEPQDVLILTKNEVAKIVRYIEEMDSAIQFGEFAPPALSCFSTLQEFVKPTELEEMKC